MGYTRYWRWNQRDRNGDFEKTVNDVDEFIDHLPDDIISRNPNDFMISVDDKIIMFNGIDDNAHEHFEFSLLCPNDFNFCKTVRKPYDLAVAGTLFIINYNFPNIIISNDGTIDNDEYAQDILKQLKIDYKTS